MRMSLVTDCLGYMSLEKVTDIATELGYESLEFTCGNWSDSPHINLDRLINSYQERIDFLKVLEERSLSIEALNCSGNQLAPNKEGKEHQKVVEKTFQLAELLEVKKVNMMSGLPGGGPNDMTANWITTSWPPVNVEILKWQWEEVAIPYWDKAVVKAKEHGIQKIAIENHGSQLVYNAETFLQLKNHVGDMVGINFDPSHLFWMGGDPITTLRKLGSTIYHVHAKDTRIEKYLADIYGVLDTKSIDQFSNRSWNYVALGHGHDIGWWKEFFSVLSMVGYDGAVSLENEDLTMDSITALKKSTQVLKEALPLNFTR